MSVLAFNNDKHTFLKFWCMHSSFRLKEKMGTTRTYSGELGIAQVGPKLIVRHLFVDRKTVSLMETT